MHIFLQYFEAIISILLIIAILLQNNTEGFSATMTSTTNSFVPTRRGSEKVLFNITIILAALFVLSAIAFIFVQ